MDIVEKIRMLCNEKVITIAELERNLGLGAGTISRWNVRVPGVDKVQKVANYFSVSTDFLLGLTDVPYWTGRQDKLDIQPALQMSSTVVSYDGIELTDDEKFMDLLYSISDRSGVEKLLKMRFLSGGAVPLRDILWRSGKTKEEIQNLCTKIMDFLVYSDKTNSI